MTKSPASKPATAKKRSSQVPRSAAANAPAPRQLSLTTRNRKLFRAIGHQLKPVVTVAGNGLTDAVMAEIQRALADHELIKVKVIAEDRKERDEVIGRVCDKLGAAIVQRVGNIVLLFKLAKNPNPALSNILRAEQR